MTGNKWRGIQTAGKELLGGTCGKTKDFKAVYMEIFRRGEWLDEALKEKEALKVEVEEMRKVFPWSEVGKEEAILEAK